MGGTEKTRYERRGSAIWITLDSPATRNALSATLIDELGALDDAIRAAADLGGLGESGYGIKYIEQELSPSEQIIVDLLGAASTMGVDLSRWTKRTTLTDKIARDVAEKAGPLLRFNDPKGVYSHCLCDIQ